MMSSMDKVSRIAYERLVARSHVEDTGYETTCLVENTGWKSGAYGRAYLFDGSRPQAHVFIYELLVGPVPEGHDVHHLCGIAPCWRKEHLKTVPVAEHRRMSSGFAGDNARKTHCPQNHPYDGDNLYINPNGSRVCRECVRQSMRRYRARKRVEFRDRSKNKGETEGQ